MGLIETFSRSASKKERTQHASPVSPSSQGQGHSRSPNFLSFFLPAAPAPSPILTPSSPILSPSTSALSGRNPGDGTSIGVPASDVPSIVVHINPLDDNTDPTPFAFKPDALAVLVHPKTLKDLDTIGGLEGLCAGLGTNPTKGLSAHSLGLGAGDGEKSGGEGAFAAPLSDRQRVYGTNSLLTRPSKSLLQLMWLALKDKVLVC